MGDFQFNIAKGQIKTLFNNVDSGSPANSRIIVVVLEVAQGDSTLKDHDTLGALLAAGGGTANVEQTTMGRKTLTGSDIALSLDDTNDRLELQLSNSITWTAASGNDTVELLFCYDPDSTGGTDTDIIPLLGYSFTSSPDGNDIEVSQNANGLIRIS